MRPTRSLAIAFVLSALLLPTLASAAPTALIVVGKADDHERSVVASAVGDVLRAASWSIKSDPLDPKDVAAIVACTSVDRPWRCIAPLAREKGFERVVLVQVEPEHGKDAAQLDIVGQLVIPGNAVPPIERSYCVKCTEASLVEAANHVAKGLMDRLPMLLQASTAIEVQTVPIGATVFIDGKEVGTSDGEFTVAPGSHTVAIELAGYRHETRSVQAGEGQTQPLSLSLSPLIGGSPPVQPVEGHSSRLVPIVLTGAGAVAVVGGLWYQATLGPPGTKTQPERLYSVPAIAVAVAGGAAIGVGVYLWFRHPAHDAAPTVSMVRGGGLVGWTRSF